MQFSYENEEDHAVPMGTTSQWIDEPLPETFQAEPVAAAAPASGQDWRVAPRAPDFSAFAYTGGDGRVVHPAPRVAPPGGARLGQIRKAEHVVAAPALAGAAAVAAQVSATQRAQAAKGNTKLLGLLDKIRAGGGLLRHAPPAGGARAPPPKRSRSNAALAVAEDSSEEEGEGGAGSEGSDKSTSEEVAAEQETATAVASRPRRRSPPANGAASDEDDVRDEDASEDSDSRSEEPGAGTAHGEGEEESLEETLAHCDRIAADLRAALAGASTDERFAGTDEEAAAHAGLRLLSAGDVLAACRHGCEPSATTPVLKSYQMVGVNFLMLLHTRHVKGAILADEMGLGKTAQAICFIACVSARRHAAGLPTEPHLVICPASVLENWARELATWAPALRVRTFHGAGRVGVRNEIDDAMDEEEDENVGPPFDVLLCCYTAFERETGDQQDDRKWLRSFHYGYAVLDEAHLVKNRASQRATRLRQVLGRSAPRRLMLTGTPLQNDLGELLALLELLMPELFNSRGALLDAAEQNASKRSSGDFSKQAVARVRHLLGPFVLRRLKSEVLSQLMPKIQHVERLDMVPSQAALYAAAVASARREMQAKAASRLPGAAAAAPVVASELERSMGTNRLKALFTFLRKVANHPLLVRTRYSAASVDEIVAVAHRRGLFGPGAPLKKVREHVETLSDFALHSVCCDERLHGALQHLCLPADAPLASGKAARLAQLLPTLKAAGSRPLIFSQWKIQLDVLEWLMRSLGLSYYRLDGSTPVEERQSMVDAFNAADSPIFAFLLSTRAGGQGINLTGADTVILHDVDFNPQIDRQAEDRSHRLGQTKPVTVYRLVCEGTVDARIAEIAQRKLSLDAAVLSSDKDAKAAESRSMAEMLAEMLQEGPPAEGGDTVVVIGDATDE